MQKPYKEKGSRGTPRDENARMLKKIQEIGNVFEFSIGSEDKTEFHFEKTPDLELKSRKTPLEVSFSSMDHENNSLLHFLSSKSKS
jgi:hypothetical protein